MSLAGKWCALGLIATAQLASQTAPALIDYNREVHAILAGRCLVCHSQEKRSGGLSLATYEDVLNGGRSGAAVKPGNSARKPARAAPHRARVHADAAGRTGAELRPKSASSRRGSTRARARLPARPQPRPSGRRRSRWSARSCPSRRGRTGANRWTASPRLPCESRRESRASEPQLVSDAVFARRAYLDIWGLLPPPENFAHS